MIDFHCHILPGLDDGARDWEESIEMARYLAGQGVTGVIATPHWLDGYFTPEPREILEKAEQLQGKLSNQGIGLKVYPGCEVHISPDLPDLVRRGKVLTVNNGGKYLLVEMPFLELPIYAENVLFHLKLQGIIPVIAHPERNNIFAKDSNKVLSLIQRGCLIQINIGSLTGFYGREVEKTVKYLVYRRAVQLIGSDMHSKGEIPVKDARNLLAIKIGNEKMKKIVQMNALQMLASESLPIESELLLRSDGLLKRLARKIWVLP